MRLGSAAVLALSIVSSPALAAAYVTYDNFSVPHGPVSDTVLGGGGVSSGPIGYTIGAHSFGRTISVELLALLAPVQAEAEVGAGVFDIRHGTGDKSEVILTYQIPASVETFKNSLTFVTGLAVFFTLIVRDNNPIDITAELNATSLGPIIPALGFPGIYRFNIPLGPVNGTLNLFFNGDAGYDLTIDNLRLWIGRNGEPFIPSPAPVSLGLFGLGLVGLALARRARKS